MLSTCVWFWLLGVPSEAWRFFLISTSVWLMLLSSESFLHALCWSVPYTIPALGLGVVMFGFNAVLAGFFIPISQLGWWYRWAYWVDPIALGTNINWVAAFTNTSWTPSPNFPTGLTGDQILGFFPQSEIRIWVNVIVLLSYIVVWQMVLFMFVRFAGLARK